MKMRDKFVEISVTEKDFDSSVAEFLFKTIKNDLRGNKKLSIALSGGSTPLPALGYSSKDYTINWEHCDFFTVDERNVPKTNSLSNFGNIERVFFKYINSSAHPMVNKNYSLEDCAIHYENFYFQKFLLRQTNYRCLT